MRALITNDDGIDSPGLRALAGVAAGAGLEVIVAAPRGERSGSSAALSALESGGRMLIERRRLSGLPDVPALAVQASPAMIVFTAVRGAFGEPPELVLSGINRGPNTGQAVLHSGTVGAALTAVSHGVPALAVSLAADARAPGEKLHWDTATSTARQVLDWLLSARRDSLRRLALSVNVPDIVAERVRGIRRAELAHYGAVQAEIRERGRDYVALTLDTIDATPQPGTDAALLAEGWATVTALCAPASVDGLDLRGLDEPAATGMRAHPSTSS